MDYEHKYKEALEKLQEALAPTKDGCKISGLTRNYLEDIFPELKGSEREKIRKKVIEVLKLNIKGAESQMQASRGVDRCFEIYACNKVIAWLEKQSHMLDPDKVIEWFRVNWWDSHIGDPIDKFKKDFEL